MGFSRLHGHIFAALQVEVVEIRLAGAESPFDFLFSGQTVFFADCSIAEYGAVFGIVGQRVEREEHELVGGKQFVGIGFGIQNPRVADFLLSFE